MSYRVDRSSAWPSSARWGWTRKSLLFDEITSALDPELVDEVLSVLRRLSERPDLTMLVVTHEMSFAREFSDRVIFMEAGQIVEDAPPDVLFTDPAQDRTRRFLRKILPHSR